MKKILSSFFILFFLIVSILFFSCSAEKAVFENTSSAKTIQKKYSSILGVNENEIQNGALYHFIDQWAGVPYKYAGKSKKGVDCSGFGSILEKEIFGKTATGSSASIYNQCNPVSKDELKEGDLIFFKIESKDPPDGRAGISHMGVYLQNNKFVHAAIKRGVVIDDLDEAYYKKYFFGAGRLR